MATGTVRGPFCGSAFSGISPVPESALNSFGEIGKELIGQFLGRTVDQALSELGQFAADLRLDIIAQQRAAVLFRQAHGGAALGETGAPALAFARDLVSVRRGTVAERTLGTDGGG